MIERFLYEEEKETGTVKYLELDADELAIALMMQCVIANEDVLADFSASDIIK